MDFECPVHCKIETSRVFVIAALPDVTAGCHSSCHVQEDGTARTVKELLQEHLQVRLRVWKVSWTYTTANAKKTRSPTVPFLSLFFLFWGVLAGRIQKNMEVAHLRQRLLDTTSCDALADDEPLIIGKDAPPRLGKCSDPLLQATAENETNLF